MVFQSYALYPHMTVFENMSFGLRLRGIAAAEIRKRVEEAARILEIGDLLHRRPRNSPAASASGSRWAAPSCASRKVFLFDEPLSNLDAKLRVHMRTEIKRIHQQVRTTTVYVTHDQVEAMTLSDYVVVMNRGRVEQYGTPQRAVPRATDPLRRRLHGFAVDELPGGDPAAVEQRLRAWN